MYVNYAPTQIDPLFYFKLSLSFFEYKLKPSKPKESIWKISLNKAINMENREFPE